MFRKMIVASCMLASASAVSAQGVPAEKIDAAMNAKIRDEGMNRSRIMWIEHELTDVYGPRPIGSPNHVAAANWAMKAMTDFGLKNAHLEPFIWRGVGWLPGRAVGYITAPVKANIKFEANPWSPSTKGTVIGQVVSLVAPVNPTPAELDAYLTSMAPKVRNGIVMVGPPPVVPPIFCPRPLRAEDSTTRARYQNPDPAAGGGRGGRGGGAGLTNFPGCVQTAGANNFGGGGRGAGAQQQTAEPGHLTAGQVNARINQLVRDNMPALRLNVQGGGRIPGEIVAQNGAGQIYDDTTPQPPTVILRNDDYGRIYRIIHEDNQPVTVEFNMQNTFYPEGKTSYITVAEIPGTDKADEVVMLGGHLDSWTSATGATDNAIGCAIMMEAARILNAVGAHPRRTIRVALWSGEEEGEYGSSAYVANHFGTAENPKPEFNKLVAYWNIDEGTGRVRGASVFGPPAAAAIVGEYLKPFEDFGVYGALPTAVRAAVGSSDHDSFVVAGLPGIGTQQDPIEYNTVTWHSNLDTYERIVPQDVMQNATMTAALMYGLANRDEMLPRFAPDKMPAPAANNRGGAVNPNATAPVLTATPHVYAITKGVPVSRVLIAAPAGAAAAAAAATPTTAALVANPAHGKLALNANGSFTYTPTAGYVGNDSFTYTISRGGQTSEPVSVVFVIK